MTNRKFKKTAGCLMAVAMMAMMAMPALAGQWQKNAAGWWWQEDNGTYPMNTWCWLDGNRDGIAECYYFNGYGYMLASTVTPDGYTVNENGAWTVNGVVQTKIVPTTTSGGASMPTVGGSSGGTATTGATTTTQASTTVANGNEIRKAMKPGDTYAVSNGTWIRDEKGFKFKKLDGFYVDPAYGKICPTAYDPYVVNDMWMTDDNGDGTWEIYGFDENGYLYTTIKDYTDWGANPYGMNDADGYLLVGHYRGTWGAVGPYEVVQRDGKWRCENGTLPDFSTDMYWQITGDYASDAARVAGGIRHEHARVSSHNNIVYKYMN